MGFDPRLAWRESDRDQKFDVGDYEELWVCAPRALYKISDRKSRAWMPGGGCLSPVAWEGQMVLTACNQNFMCPVIRTQSCTVL